MPAFKVLLHGSNLYLEHESGISQEYGFYQTFWIEANRLEEAKSVALRLAKRQERLAAATARAPISLSIEEAEELTEEALEHGVLEFPSRTGLALYLNEDSRD